MDHERCGFRSRRRCRDGRRVRPRWRRSNLAWTKSGARGQGARSAPLSVQGLRERRAHRHGAEKERWLSFGGLRRARRIAASWRRFGKRRTGLPGSSRPTRPSAAGADPGRRRSHRRDPQPHPIRGASVPQNEKKVEDVDPDRQIMARPTAAQKRRLGRSAITPQGLKKARRQGHVPRRSVDGWRPPVSRAKPALRMALTRPACDNRGRQQPSPRAGRSDRTMNCGGRRPCVITSFLSSIGP